MSTLTPGWRFTLPSGLREAFGWREGVWLQSVASGSTLFLHGGEERLGALGTSQIDAASGNSAEMRVGAGGKVIVPSVLREHLTWEPGVRLVAVEDDGCLAISPCCSVRKCRSCGSTLGVKEIIPNLYLCEDCLRAYSEGLRKAGRHRSRGG